MTRLLSWIVLLFVFGTFVFVACSALRTRAAAGKGMPEYSLFSVEPNGLSAAAQPLQRLGWEPVALTRPIQHSEYREARGCLLVLAEPAEIGWLPHRASEMSELDVQGMLRWVGRGNTLFFCSRHTTALHHALDVFVENDTRASEDMTTEVALGEGGGYTDDIDHLVVEGHDVLRGGGLPLWWVGNDPGALLIRHGKGRVLVVSDPSILTLRGLWRGDNLRFLINVAGLDAGDGRVYFDEYHHGLRSGGGFWGYLHYHGQQWTVLVVAAILAMAAWAVAVRMGRAVSIPSEKQADAVDYASALARIYQRGGVQHLLAETLCRDFLTAITCHLRLRRSVLPAEILAAWRRQHPREKSQDLEALLRGVTTLRGSAVSQGQMLTWIRNFDRFKTEVLRAG